MAPGDQKCSRLDAVGIDAIARAMQSADALHANRRGARAFDLRAHGGQQRGQVGNLGLTRAVLHQCFALGQHRGHQQILRACDGNLVEDQMRAKQPLHARLQIAVFLGDRGAHLLQAADMQIDGPAAYGASAGHGHARHSRAGNQRTQHQRTGAHRLDNLVFGDGVGERAATDLDAIWLRVVNPDFSAHRREQLALGVDVPHLGKVFQRDLVLGQNRRRHAGQSRVLGARDANRPDERIAAAYDKFIHES